jgi:hypothetical protein
MDGAGGEAIGTPSSGLAFKEEQSADEYYRCMLAELKAHKDAKTWLLTASAREQQRTNYLILANVNSAVAGM